MERQESIQRFEQYLQRRAPGRRTAVDYVSDIRQFAQACAQPWREVTMQDIDAFVDQQRQAGYSGATVKRRVAALKVFFDFLAEESSDLAWPNPVRFKRHAGKPAKHLPRDLSDAQVEQLWAAMDEPRDRAWFVLMVRGGLRVSEVVRLTGDDLLRPPDADQPARLRVSGKGQKERVVLLTADAYAVLQTWLAQRPASTYGELFLNEHGRPLRANGIEWLLHRYGERIGLKVTPHQLRHTYARALTEAGMPITSLGKLMGHADIQTTQLYTAGADPELCQSYLAAMTQLAELTVNPVAPPAQQAPAVPAPRAGAPPSMAARRFPVQPDPPAPPDWDRWNPNWPTPIRTACLTWIQRRWPTWKPSRRREQALKELREFQVFFAWQFQQRPIATLAQVHLADLQAYQIARGAEGRATTCINRTLDDVLSLLKDHAEAGQAVDASVFRLRKLPRPESLPRSLNASQYQALEAFVTARLAGDNGLSLTRLENACFLVLAHSGLRASEWHDLCWQDLDLASGRLVVRQGKGQRDRVVYLSATGCRALECYRAGLEAVGAPCMPAAPVWRLPDGHVPTTGWLRKHVAKLGQSAGVPDVSPHRLRHTLATRLLNAGMDITRIQKLLGHEHIQTTLIYARVEDRVVEADYRRAMNQIERAAMPLSTTAVPAEGWPTGTPARLPAAKEAFDNSV